ncbi:four helix bundle protein [Bacteroidales bacterium]
MTISSFEDLEIWQQAREQAKLVRQLTRKEAFSKDLRFCGQINSSAGSVMDNIAEGFERDGHKEFIQFLYIAKASNAECRSQIYRALDAGFISQTEHDEIISHSTSLKNKIIGLIKYLKANPQKGIKYV